MSWTFMGTAVWRLTCSGQSRTNLKQELGKYTSAIQGRHPGMGLSYFTDGLGEALLAEWSDITAAEGGLVMANPGLMEGSSRLQAALFFLGDPLSKALAEVDLADSFVVDDFLWAAFGDDLPLIQDVGAVGDS